jgi:hypothetical protein
MRQTLAKVACIIGFFAFGADAMSQNVPLRVGMNYTQSRKVLLDNGWQPFLPAGANLLACGDANPCNNRSINLEKALRRQFRARGWYETVHCFPTGKGLCYHQFYDINGRGLVVVTGSGSYSEMPSVVQFYYKDLLNR